MFFFQQVFFSKRNCSTPKMTKIPTRIFGDFGGWRLSWGLGIGGSAGDQRERRAAEEGAAGKKTCRRHLQLMKNCSERNMSKHPGSLGCDIGRSVVLGFSSRTTFSLPKALLKMIFFFLRCDTKYISRSFIELQLVMDIE